MKKFFRVFNLFKDVESYDVIQKNIIEAKRFTTDKYMRTFGKELDESQSNGELHRNDLSKKADEYCGRWAVSFPNILLWIFVSFVILDWFLGVSDPASDSFMTAALLYLYLRQSFVTRATVSELERIKRLQGIDR